MESGLRARVYLGRRHQLHEGASLQDGQTVSAVEIAGKKVASFKLNDAPVNPYNSHIHNCAHIVQQSGILMIGYDAVSYDFILGFRIRDETGELEKCELPTGEGATTFQRTLDAMLAKANN